MTTKWLASLQRWLSGRKPGRTRRWHQPTIELLEDRRLLTTVFSQTNLVSDGAVAANQH